MPWTKESWAIPTHCFPLVHSRLVSSTSSPNGTSSKSTGGHFLQGNNETITFSLRVGTSLGIDQRVLRVETHRELANWARYLVQGAHLAALTTKEACFGKSY